MSLNSILKGITGQTGSGLLKSLGQSETVRDFRHASRLFVENNFALAPKNQFLYHVFFNVNQAVLNRSRWARADSLQKIEAGMLVKSVDLPRFKMDTKTMNAYNKSHIVQTKIKYDPISIVMHDDTANVIRDLWFAYMSYYFRDADHQPAGYARRNVYNQRPTDSWGYSPLTSEGRETEPFFTSIEIYSLSQKKFSMYELMNPIIDGFDHGRHEAASATGLMEHTMRVSYEAVKYKEGFANGGAVKGFGKEHYDRQPSPLTPLGGGTQSILGPGGVIDVASSIVGDLADGNILGAGLAALRASQTLKNFNLKDSIKTEAAEIVTGAIRNTANSTSPFSFPNIGVVNNSANKVNAVLQRTNTTGSGLISPDTRNIATSQGQGIASIFSNPRL